jgi:outer membrane protein assembly factor BamA
MRMLGLVVLFTVSLAQEPAFTMESIVAPGAKRLNVDQVIALSGLKPGSSVRLSELQPAVERLASTGLFSSVAYRYATAESRLAVTFDITEADWTMPVVFDNFVWLSDAELNAAVVKRVPTFNGTSPTNGNAVSYFVRTLQDILRERNLPGTVTHVASLNMKTQAQQYLFKVTQPTPSICAVRVTGASPSWEREISKVTTPLIGSEYSKSYLTALSAATLLDTYLARGHWTAAIAPPKAAIAAGCDGVTVDVAVTDGPVYAWDEPAWAGNALLSAKDLTAMMNIRAGSVADGSQLTVGLRKIREAYAVAGHVLAAVTYAPAVVAETKRVRLDMSVKEGPQFRMGAVEIAGLPPAEAASLQKRWRLKAGDVFDASYPSKFVADEVRPVLRRLKLRGAVPEMRADTPRQLVNVRIVVQR